METTAQKRHGDTTGDSTSGDRLPRRQAAVAALRGGLVVSCQAPPGHPLATPATIAALARCGELGGAVAVRIESADDIRAVKASVAVPVIGIKKVMVGGGRPFITPTFEACAELTAAGADLVAVEASRDNRRDPTEVATLIDRVHRELGVAVMADVSTYEEGRAAADAGADLVATTLAGYTTASPPRNDPDLDLLAALADSGIPTVLEGHVRRPADVAAAFARGAWAVVVGTAITDPLAITRWFAAALPAELGEVRRSV